MLHIKKNNQKQGNSGKSTFFRQMWLLDETNKGTQMDAKEALTLIYNNIIKEIQYLCKYYWNNQSQLQVMLLKFRLFAFFLYLYFF